MNYDKRYQDITYPQTPKYPAKPQLDKPELWRKFVDELETYHKLYEEYKKELASHEHAIEQFEENFWKEVFYHEKVSQEHPKAQLAKDLAWERGHSCGYDEVADIFAEYAQFLKD